MLTRLLVCGIIATTFAACKSRRHGLEEPKQIDASAESTNLNPATLILTFDRSIDNEQSLKLGGSFRKAAPAASLRDVDLNNPALVVSREVSRRADSQLVDASRGIDPDSASIVNRFLRDSDLLALRQVDKMGYADATDTMVQRGWGKVEINGKAELRRYDDASLTDAQRFMILDKSLGIATEFRAIELTTKADKGQLSALAQKIRTSNIEELGLTSKEHPFTSSDIDFIAEVLTTDGAKGPSKIKHLVIEGALPDGWGAQLQGALAKNDSLKVFEARKSGGNWGGQFVTAFKDSKRLTMLEVDGEGFRMSDVAPLRSTLDGVTIATEDMETLAQVVKGAPNLTHLRLAGNLKDGWGASLGEAIKGHEQLASLSLIKAEINANFAMDLKASLREGSGRLKNLDVRSQAGIEAADLDVILDSSVVNLSLEGRAAQGALIQLFRSQPKPTELRSIQMRNIQSDLAVLDVETIAEIGRNWRIRTLMWDIPSLDSRNIAAFSEALKTNRGLRDVQLSNLTLNRQDYVRLVDGIAKNNEISSVRLQAKGHPTDILVDALKENPRVVKLGMEPIDLYSQDLTRKIADNGNFTRLTIDKPTFDETSVTNLITIMKSNPKLEEIVLTNAAESTNLTASKMVEFAGAIRDHPSLKSVDVRGAFQQVVYAGKGRKTKGPSQLSPILAEDPGVAGKIKVGDF